MFVKIICQNSAAYTKNQEIYFYSKLLNIYSFRRPPLSPPQKIAKIHKKFTPLSTTELKFVFVVFLFNSAAIMISPQKSCRPLHTPNFLPNKRFPSRHKVPTPQKLEKRLQKNYLCGILYMKKQLIKNEGKIWQNTDVTE